MLSIWYSRFCISRWWLFSILRIFLSVAIENSFSCVSSCLISFLRPPTWYLSILSSSASVGCSIL